MDRFDRLLTDYTTPDPARAAHALDAAAHLDSPAYCRDPATAARTATPDELRRTLDQAELQIAEGDFAAAAATVEQTPANHQDHPRTLWLRGWLAGETTPDRRSDRLLEESMHEAARALDHDTFVRAATYRLKSLVHDLGEPAEAAALAPWIETIAAQWDPGTAFDRWFRAEFAEGRGFLLVATGEYLAATVQHGHALRLRVEDDGPDHPRVAKSHHNLAVSLAYTGDAYDEAHAHYLAALQIRHEQLGEAHPDTLETAFGMAQAECEFFEPDAEHDPAALTDCLSDLAANLDDYRRDPTLDRRGLHRRAVTIAYHALDAGCIPCVEDALATARLALAGLDDVDLRERTDLLAVQARLHLARDDHPAALAAFTTGVALWEAAGRLEAPYFEHLDGAVVVAVEMQQEDAAAALLLDRSATMADAPCIARERYAGSLDALVEFLGPDRCVADLRSAAADARRPCP